MSSTSTLISGKKSAGSTTLYCEYDYPSDKAPLSQFVTQESVSATKYSKSVGVKGAVGGTIRRRSTGFAARPPSTPCTYGLYWQGSTKRSVYCTDFTAEGSSSYWTTSPSANCNFIAAPSNNYNFFRFEYGDGTPVSKTSSDFGETQNSYKVMSPSSSSVLGGRRYGLLHMGGYVKSDDTVVAVFSHTLLIYFIDESGELLNICTKDMSKMRQLYVAGGTKLSAVTSGDAMPRKSGSDMNYLPQIGSVADDGSVLVGYKVKKYNSSTASIISGEALATITSADSTIGDIDGVLTSANVAFTRDTASGVDDEFGFYRDVVLEGVYLRPKHTTASTSGAEHEQSSPSVTASPASATAGTTVTLSAQTDGLATCQFFGWSATYVEDGVTKSLPVTAGTDAGTATFTMPDAEVAATAAYSPKIFTLNATTGSGGTGTSVEVYDADGEAWVAPPNDGVPYGSKVRFGAIPSAGYGFSAWYDGDTPLPTTSVDSGTYMYVVNSVDRNLDLVAKFKCDITIGASTGSGYSGYVVVNGEPKSASSVTIPCEVGSVVQIAAVATEGFFTGWVEVSGSGGSQTTTPVSLAQDDSIIVSVAKHYVATFSASETDYYVGVKSRNDDAGEDDTTGSCGYIALSGGNVTEVGPSDVETLVENETLSSDFSSCLKVYKVTGVSPVVFSAMQTGSVPYRGIAWSDQVVQGGASLMGAGASNVALSVVVASGSRSFNSNVIGTVHWGTASTATVTVRTDDPAKGSVSLIGGGGTAVDGTSASAEFEDGAIVTVVAAAANGYVFDGWYVGDSKIANAGAEYSFAIGSADVSIVAKFVADTDAIFEWEGGTGNKRMTWASKVYTLPRPFDPVAARVDATGYGENDVKLSVGTYSSPNAPAPESPTSRDHEIPVESQDGRRLPRMRPERFMRVKVESDVEIDAIVVGTNMAEVN